MDKASIGEIEDFLEGASTRERSSWEQTRLLSFIIARIGGGDADTIEEFMPLSWDEDLTDDGCEEIDQSEVNRLRAQAKQLENDLKDGRYTL
ncbi:hypothetical protein [uncultured Parabacteroides sp.]|uniref:hypothetical protein n=1 Tax=uncultured Parabacteroides sp. TaxID=512312 RepID=UPI0026DB2B0D|nr:hypothetical protein [uncultured Parabacteroides sp.]